MFIHFIVFLFVLPIDQAARLKHVARARPAVKGEKVQCSQKTQNGYGRHSCGDSWRETYFSTARCAWVENSCVPNCLHPRNQDAKLCETSFCVWNTDTETCSFDPKRATARRAFCDSEAGMVDRRFVDKNGLQPDFYAHSNLEGKQLGYNRTSNKKLFCKGMLGDDDDQFVADGKEPVDEILSGMMRCWRPNPENRASYHDPSLQAAMKAQLSSSMEGLGRWPKLEMFPIIMTHPLFGGLAHHTTVGLTNTINDVYTAHCHEHDYNAAPATLDQAGCNFFRASFAPVKELINCMMPLIGQDRHKQLWSKVAETAENHAVVERGVSVLSGDSHVKWLTSGLFWQLGVKEFSIMLKQWHDCRAQGRFGACNRWLSDWERAIEIVKQVEQDSWEGLDAVGIRELLRLRILGTIGIPSDGHISALEGKTVAAIMGQCFKVPFAGAAGSLLLKESLRCQPLMWDFVQIPALPQTALWPKHVKDHVELELRYTHPLCARMVLAGLVRPYSRTRYPIDNLKLLRLWELSDNTCLTVDTGNCVNFGDCWWSFMERHVGHVHEFCNPPPKCCCREPKEYHLLDSVWNETLGKEQCADGKCCVLDYWNDCNTGYNEDKSHALCEVAFPDAAHYKHGWYGPRNR